VILISNLGARVQFQRGVVTGRKQAISYEDGEDSS
jgi:hypothetical protein